MSVTDEYQVTFLKINCNEQPKVVLSFKVLSDLSLQAWYEDSNLPAKKLSWLLGTANKCDRWSKFDTLLSHLASYEESKSDVRDKLWHCISVIHNISENQSVSQSFLPNKILWFCAEQLALTLTSTPKYNCEFLLWACNVYYSSPTCYKMLRNSGVMTLPHPAYLRKLTSYGGTYDVGLENSHITYLKKNCLL